MRHQGQTFQALSALALMCALAGPAFTQVTPRFTLDQDASVAPGGTATLDLFVSGGPADTAALNFTISIADDAGANLLSGPITATKAAGVPGDMVFETNNPSRTGGVELRGVLYAPAGSNSTVDLSGNEVPVAVISLPISAEAAASQTVTVRLDQVGGDGDGFDDADNGFTGLVGISNAAGQSIVPGNAAANEERPLDPTLLSSTVTVEGVQLPDPASRTFAATGETSIGDAESRWEYANDPQGGLPATSGAPLVISVDSDARFGNLRTRNLNSQRWPSSVDGQASTFFVKWTYSSDAAQPWLVPQVRLRAASAGSIVSFLNLLQEQPTSNQGVLEAVPPVVVPFNNTDYEGMVAYYTPEFIKAGSENPWSFQFDVLSYAAGHSASLTGNDMMVNTIDIQEVPMDVLGAGTAVYEADYETSGVPDSFTSSSPFGFLGENTPPVTFDSTGGMTIIPVDGPREDGFFSFGTWEGQIPGFTIAADTVYSVTARVAAVAPAGGTLDEALTPNSRIRLRAGGRNDMVHEMLFSEDPARAQQFLDDTGQTGVTPWRPTADGRDFVSVVYFPQEFVGQDVKMFFDSYKLDGADNGGVKLEALTVRAHQMPDLDID